MQGVEAPVVPACLNDARRLSNFRWCVRRADRSRARPRRPPCHILDQVWAKPPSLHACRLTNAIRLRTSHRGRNNRDPIYLVPKIQVFVHASALHSKSVASDIHTQCNICTILVSPDGIVCTTSLLPGPGRRGTRDSAGVRYSREVLGDEAPGIRPGRGIHARQLVEAGRRNSPRLGQAPKPPALLPTRRGTRRWRSDFRGESVGGYALRFDLPPGYKKKWPAAQPEEGAPPPAPGRQNSPTPRPECGGRSGDNPATVLPTRFGLERHH